MVAGIEQQMHLSAAQTLMPAGFHLGKYAIDAPSAARLLADGDVIKLASHW